MNIILLERVDKLGAIGDVVTVRDGYARNFLLPNNKALRANDANKKIFEANRERLEAENAAKRGEAETEAKAIDGTTIVLIRQSSNAGQLYGSVAVRDIVDALEGDGHDINKSQIALERPIKSIGVHEVRVTLHPEVAVTVKANVARSPEEAELQAQGVDVMAQMFEEERDTGGFTENKDPNAEPGEVLAEGDAREDNAEAAVETAETTEAEAEAGDKPDA